MVTLRWAWLVLAMVAACGVGELPDDDPRLTPVVRACRKAGPAVVNIATTRTIPARLGFFGRNLFEDIFPGRSYSRRVPVTSLGSGVVISPDGYIVTNAHVIRGAQEIHVTFDTPKQHAARVIVADDEADLAIIKIDPPADGGGWPHLPPGRSHDLLVGETVIAIGNPMGYTNTVTTGVISATRRTLRFRDGLTYENLIQTDAPINQGNSGGPLLNVKGELIGINTAIRPDAQNIGFAVPVQTLKAMLPRMLDIERLNRVVFGARLAGRDGRVVVASLREGSPAHGPLQVGDEVLAIRSRPVRQITQAVFALLDVNADEPIAFQLRRDGQVIDATVTIQPRPRPDARTLAAKRLGLRVRDVTAELAGRHGLGVRDGVLVIGVEDGSPADRLGIRLKDIIFRLGGYTVRDLESLGQVLEDAPADRPLRIGVLRGNIAVLADILLRDGP
jgi:serine protease Do